ncbi:MAG: hypothetical protein NTX45_29825 [Proteobacteria bacterium]|nr:hypothetical protein [Pseudomonadota bacterium]
MQGDFSVLYFDPHEQGRGVSPPSLGVLRNVNGVLHQQGRVMSDADLTEGELLELAWNGQAGRDIVGAGVCAVPSTEPEGFRIESALASGSEVRVMVRPGRAWADGILTRLAGVAADPAAPVERRARYFGPPLADPMPQTDSITEGTRDAVILEVSEEALHGFQYPERLIEPALGGPDTAERSYVNVRFRLLRLAAGEDCTTILPRLKDDPSVKGRLTASLAPVTAITGDCPVVGGGGYLGFEHNLYRIEIADGSPTAPPRFKWSQWNGGLVGRGRFDATQTPAIVILDAGRAAIVNSGLTEFYLEALQYDELDGMWNVVYGSTATLNTGHDLELTSPPIHGALPNTADSVFIRLWNGLRDIADFTNTIQPVELRDGIRLAFDAPAPGKYQPRDYWTFTVRAGEIPNLPVLVDHAPPVGIAYHCVPLAEINWTARKDTTISGSIEDCRRRFRPLTNQKICCTLLVGDGVSSFGDFNSLEEAASHLSASGGELCLLPGLHRANLSLDGGRNIKIHGCSRRTVVLPRTETRTQPILHFIDCEGIEVSHLDLITYDGVAVSIEGRMEGSCQGLSIHDNRMIARSNAIRATNAAGLSIANNRLHLLDTVDGLATVSIHADDTLIERNTLVLLPFVEVPPGQTPGTENPDPADPCSKPEVLYQYPLLVMAYAVNAWAYVIALLVPKQPYRALGGIHVRAGSERVRILENTIIGGAGNGITLGGDLDPPDSPAPAVRASVAGAGETAGAGTASTVAVTVKSSGQFLARVLDSQKQPVTDVDVYLQADTTATDRSDAQGYVSIKTASGDYTLDVSPAYRIVNVAESTQEGVSVTVLTVAAQTDAVYGRGFLHEISVEFNDISMMGLSGIGFALRSYALLKRAAVSQTNDPKATLLGYIDDFVLTIALTPLLLATDPVRDLAILNNRIHHNLRNPFTEALLSLAQSIGFGGVSLAAVESAVISGNHVYENGQQAGEPVCGVFIGYGNDLEITGNVLATNGVASGNNRKNQLSAGLRGGFYIRFAGALTTHFSTSTGRKPALRVHDNRVDQSVGRALTAFAFGPVSVVNNHLNSEFTGRFGLIDQIVGGVLIFNLGGIHRVLARLFRPYLKNSTIFTKGGSDRSFALATETSLPGGETLFDDNYVRLGTVNRSLISQLMIAFDDLGYASNTASSFRGDPFIANAALFADTVRATSSRFREDANQTISLLSGAFRVNTTALNQADHCIIVLPPRSGSGDPLPTVDQPNQVLDSKLCEALGMTEGTTNFFVQSLSANANELGGTLPQDAFTPAEVATRSRGYAAKSMVAVSANQVAVNRAYQYEARRLSVKLGAGHPRVVALQAQADGGAQMVQVLSTSAEAATLQAPTPAKGGAAVSGRFANDRSQGQPGYTVELLDGKGARVYTVGRTDASGFFAAQLDPAQTATLAKAGGLYPRVVDAQNNEVYRATDTITIAPDANIQTTLTVPVRVVPTPVVVPDAEPPCPPNPPYPPKPETDDGDAWIVQGHISNAKGKGLPGMVVNVYDKELLFDDRLGTTETDKNGDYRLVYRTCEFLDLIEKRPDLYLNITDRGGKLCYTSEQAVNYDAGRVETINVVLPAGDGKKAS